MQAGLQTEGHHLDCKGFMLLCGMTWQEVSAVVECIGKE